MDISGSGIGGGRRGGKEMRVTPSQLDGDARTQAWQEITKSQPRYAGYQQKPTAPSR
jgi:hypothetical protein